MLYIIGHDLNRQQAYKLANWWNANTKDRFVVEPDWNKMPAGGKKRYRVVRQGLTSF